MPESKRRKPKSQVNVGAKAQRRIREAIQETLRPPVKPVPNTYTTSGFQAKGAENIYSGGDRIVRARNLKKIKQASGGALVATGIAGTGYGIYRHRKNRD